MDWNAIVKGAGTSFLDGMTGGLAGGLVNKIFGGGSSSSTKVDKVRQDELRTEDWARQIYLTDRAQDETIQRRVSDAKKAGLSPMAAMGAAGTSIPNINASYTPPNSTSKGRDDLVGSLLNHVLEDKRLDKQIEIMKLQFAAQQDAATRDAVTDQREPQPRNIHDSERKSGTAVTSTGKEYEIPSGTPQRALEDEIGEWADWMPDTVKRAWAIFRAQLQNPVTVDQFRKFASKHKLWDVMPPELRYKYGYRKDVRRRTYKSRARVYKVYPDPDFGPMP